MTPVTIGDQKFIKDADKGWIDSKTKQPADKGLIRLLDSLVIDEPVQKKLRVKIDKSVEPISIHGQKFVYDANQGWIDEKTKVRAPDSLQLILNNATPKFEAADVDNLTSSLGMAGKAATQKTKVKASPKTGAGKLVNNSNNSINKPLIAMINQLASIDSYLKQQLENKQLIASKEFAEAKEAVIEAKDSNQNEEIKAPDAEKESSNNLLGAMALAGLIAYQFDPVKETISELAKFGKEAASYVIDIAKTINSAFEWLMGDGASSAGSTGTANAVNIGPAASTQKDFFKPSASFASYAKPPVQISSLSKPSAGVLSADPKARQQAFKQKDATNLPVATNAPAPKMDTSLSGWSIKAKPSVVNTPPKTPTVAQPPAVVNKPKAVQPLKLDKNFGDTWAKNLKSNKGNVANKIPQNDIVALGNYLISKGADKSKMEHSAISGRVGEHSDNSRHYRGMAIDVNFPGPNEASILDALAPQIKAAGYNVLWRTKGHYSHMHVSVGGPEGIGGFGGGESPIAETVDTIANVMDTAKNLFGKAGAALIGTKDYTRRELTTPASKLGPLAQSYAMEKTNSMVESRTPKPTPSVKPASPPNINPNKQSQVIQSPATTNDMSSINYYLERFGFAPTQSELNMV